MAERDWEYIGSEDTDDSHISRFKDRRTGKIEEVVLTPEIPYGDPRRDVPGYIWYPFWNKQSGVDNYAYDNYLQCILWQTEKDIASKCEFADEIMASRQKFIYRVPSTHLEEMFCRGQF